ncbi:hypothetical protein J6590_082839 [Homalodisca vitripennis]|nr:hypothetical protein J6590_082839 [Homalodisca vitripennis]
MSTTPPQFLSLVTLVLLQLKVITDFTSSLVFYISRHLFTSHGMHLRVPGKRLFAKLIIEALLRINIPGCDPSSFIMASSADKPPSTTRPVAAAELHHGVKSSSDTTGPSDDT